MAAGCCTGSGGRNIFRYSLSHADSFLHRKSESGVKSADTLVSFPDLKIHLYTPLSSQRALREPNQLRTHALATMCRRHGDRIDPTPMSVVSGHHRADDRPT